MGLVSLRIIDKKNQQTLINAQTKLVSGSVEILARLAFMGTGLTSSRRLV
jgi:hypothetical protein